MTNWSIAHHRVAIAGRVLDGGTQKPVAGAEVTITTMPAEFKMALERLSLRQGKGWVRTSERPDKTRSRTDGIFHFLDLPAGKYGLSALLPNCGKRYGEARQEAIVSRDEQENSGRKYLKKIWIKLVLQPTAVKGRVFDAVQSAGVPMAEVRVKGTGERAFSDAQGQFVLGPIEPGKRVLQTFAQGYGLEEKEIIVAGPGHVQEENFRLERRHR